MTGAAVHTDDLTHNFETAHRLPHLDGKCRSLHGHSWYVEVSVAFPALRDGIGVEFGAFKSGLRNWIDTNVDHGVMLGADDPVVDALSRFTETKIYRFGAGNDARPEEKLATDLQWPTVENVAVVMHRVAAEVLAACDGAPDGWVRRVRVTETRVNASTYELLGHEARS